MMVEELAKQAVRGLVRTGEFEALKQAKSRLEKNTQAKKSLEQFHHEKDCAEQSAVSKPDMRTLKNQFDELLKNPDIAAYYKAGLGFSYMVARFHHLIDMLIKQQLEDKGSNVV